MVELLAPAGTYDSFLAALNAGANAIYLGGEKYSARAYADNFTSEQIVNAIHIAHLHACKIYLTLNTLIKENEIDGIVEYVKPFYEAGLDGVIVQDFGVIYILKHAFPEMEMHASTQMTITGADGALFAKEYGFSRIVPARELSLAEIKEIKEKVDIEIECFIHGAMCYGYSGQCLFSSILGGRSGNRGRCAGPCRLPYRVCAEAVQKSSKEEYPISMKDMCVLHILPELIEAGIDSFKIEGRMKSPAYAAGVTALYRKYIDLYNQVGREAYQVADEDVDTLMHLYIRSEISDGYYHKHNHANMITLEKPSYLGTDDLLAQRLMDRYVKEPSKSAVNISMKLHVDQPAFIAISSKDFSIEVTLEGDMVQLAAKRPIGKEQVEDAVVKLGNTGLSCVNFDLSMDENIFVPVGKLKELRRNAVALFEEKLLCERGFEHRNFQENTTALQVVPAMQNTDTKFDKKQIHVGCMTIQQLEVVLSFYPDRIYVDADLLMKQSEKILSLLEKSSTDIYLSLPYMKRLRDEQYYTALAAYIKEHSFVKGLLLHTIDQMQYGLRVKKECAIKLVADTSLYVWNHLAYRFISAYADEVTLPYELNYGEGRELTDLLGWERNMSQVVYSTIPMLISANCILKTKGACKKRSCLSTRQFLEDRYQKQFPVYNNCEHCYNIIYNSVPLSLHNKWKQVAKMKVNAYRLDFVYEDADQCRDIFTLYQDKLNGIQTASTMEEGSYTTGHFTRNVE